jgi:carbonic anhydrase-like protein
MKNPDILFRSTVPYEEARIHAAAVFCSDGRIGDQIDDFLHQGLGLPRFDRVACPGGPVCLAGHLVTFWEARGVEEQLRFLVRVHGVTRVVLIQHESCAYYAARLGVSGAKLYERQVEDLEKARWSVLRVAPGVEVTGYYARCLGDRIGFEEVLSVPSLAVPTR